MLLGSIGYLLHKTVSLRLENISTYLICRNKHRDLDRMKRQINIFQMKELDKTPEKQLNEVEISILTNKEFKVMIIKMLNKQGRRYE